MTDDRKQEYTLRITQANRTQLVVILYEMLLDYMQEAVDSAEVRERLQFREALRKSKNCVRELIRSLNMEYEVARNLYRLYRYVHRRLVDADIKDSAAPVEEGQAVVRSLYEAYAEVSRQDGSEPLLANTQAVYAGLTYGRDISHTNLTDEGINRGFRA